MVRKGYRANTVFSKRKAAPVTTLVSVTVTMNKSKNAQEEKSMRVEISHSGEPKLNPHSISLLKSCAQ